MLAAAILNAESNEREILENALRRYLSEHTLRMEVYAYAHAQDFWEARQQRYFELLLVMVRQGEEEGDQPGPAAAGAGSGNPAGVHQSRCGLAVESYRVRAHDYLLWPFSYAQFETMMNLCARTLRRRRPFVEIKEGRLTTRVLLEDIFYTDYHNHYIQIHLRDRVIRTYMTFPALRI
jgi:DNA-binding LytR/AlgR family response regulator